MLLILLSELGVVNKVLTVVRVSGYQECFVFNEGLGEWWMFVFIVVITTVSLRAVELRVNIGM